MEKVVILPDNDNPGREYATRIANTLHGKVKELKIVELPGLQDKGDIIDWVKIPGNNIEKLIELVKNAPIWKPNDLLEGRNKNLRVLCITDFLSLNFPVRENILSPWLNTQGLVMVHGIRGLGKTFFVIGVAMAVTSGGIFLKWKSNKPYGVLHLDGEMPAVTLQKRYCQFIISNDSEITAPLKIVTPDLQEFGMPDLSCNTGREVLEPHLEGISLVIVDNISTLCKGGRENEAESWLPVQEWALKLRTRGISVLFVHHSGKAGLQRGTSRREDILDTVISLKRPADYRPDEGARFEVHFEKSRGIYGDDVKPFEAMLIAGIDGKQQWVTKDLEESTTEKIVKLLGEGMSQNEIAEELKISKGTVSKHKQKAKNRKLL
jgi:putative DNA primase/helicase